MDLTFIFHSFSLLVFLGLGLLLTDSWRRKKYFLKCLRVSQQKNSASFLVDWPQLFLQNWCRFLEIPFLKPHFSNNSSPVKIKPACWFEFYRLFGITLVSWQTQRGEPNIIVASSIPLTQINQWELTLSDSFTGVAPVRIHNAQANKKDISHV